MKDHFEDLMEHLSNYVHAVADYTSWLNSDRSGDTWCGSDGSRHLRLARCSLEALIHEQLIPLRARIAKLESELELSDPNVVVTRVCARPKAGPIPEQRCSESG